jgi:hypothetical protein
VKSTESCSIFMVCDEAPAATASGVNGVESDRSEPGLAWSALLDSGERSDQLRCCGNPSWT